MFLRDITNRRARAEELRKANEAAIFQARTLQLLNDVSRELEFCSTWTNCFINCDLLYQTVEFHTFSVFWWIHQERNSSISFLVPINDCAKPDISIENGLMWSSGADRRPWLQVKFATISLYQFDKRTRSELCYR